MDGEWQRHKTCASNEKETHSGRGVAGVCPPSKLQLLAKHRHDSCLHISRKKTQLAGIQKVVQSE